MQITKKIFITGTNRGLGKQLVKLLHKENPQVEIHISSRSQPELLSQQWTNQLPGHKFVTYQIDLNSPQSVAKSVQLIKDRDIQFDSIVANAAVGADMGQTIPSVELARSTLITNVNSTIDFIKQFLPVLSDNGRVIVISSILGAIDAHSEQFKNLAANPAITEQQIHQVVDEYIKAAEAKDMGTFHWSAYRTSKVLLNSWSRFILPNYLKEGQSQVCLHPGWCQTDMGGQQAILTAEQGAQRINEGIRLKQTIPSKFWNTKWVDFYTCQ